MTDETKDPTFSDDSGMMAVAFSHGAGRNETSRPESCQVSPVSSRVCPMYGTKSCENPNHWEEPAPVEDWHREVARLVLQASRTHVTRGPLFLVPVSQALADAEERGRRLERERIANEIEQGRAKLTLMSTPVARLRFGQRMALAEWIRGASRG